MEEKRKLMNQLMSLEYLIVSGFPWVPLCSKDAIFRQGWLLTYFNFVHFSSRPSQPEEVHGACIFTLGNKLIAVFSLPKITKVLEIKAVVCDMGYDVFDRYCLNVDHTFAKGSYMHHAETVKCMRFKSFHAFLEGYRVFAAYSHFTVDSAYGSQQL